MFDAINAASDTTTTNPIATASQSELHPCNGEEVPAVLLCSG